MPRHGLCKHGLDSFIVRVQDGKQLYFKQLGKLKDNSLSDEVLRKLTFKMINAVLVFNNSGQPRLTKFYTQLVPLTSYISFFFSQKLTTTGHPNPTIPHHPNLHPRLPTAVFRLQLPPPPASPLPRRLLLLLRRYTLRRPDPNNLPHLRHPLLHPNLHLNRIPPGPHRPHPSLRRGIRPLIRERVRIGSDIRV